MKKGTDSHASSMFLFSDTVLLFKLALAHGLAGPNACLGSRAESARSLQIFYAGVVALYDQLVTTPTTAARQLQTAQQTRHLPYSSVDTVFISDAAQAPSGVLKAKLGTLQAHYGDSGIPFEAELTQVKEDRFVMTD
jgi:hypothetical protein